MPGGIIVEGSEFAKTFCPEMIIERSTTSFEAVTNLSRRSGHSTRRNIKMLHLRRESSQLEAVECMVMRDRAFISLTPV